MSAENGNGTATKIVLALALAVAGAVGAAIASPWANSGAKALEKAQALEIALAVERTERESMKRDIAEIKETTRSIWRALEDERKRKAGR